MTSGQFLSSMSSAGFAGDVDSVAFYQLLCVGKRSIRPYSWEYCMVISLVRFPNPRGVISCLESRHWPCGAGLLRGEEGWGFKNEGAWQAPRVLAFASPPAQRPVLPPLRGSDSILALPGVSVGLWASLHPRLAILPPLPGFMRMPPVSPASGGMSRHGFPGLHPPPPGVPAALHPCLSILPPRRTGLDESISWRLLFP